MRHTADVPPFDADGLDEPNVEPRWADFVPRPPGVVGRLFGGNARHERAEAAARQAYEQECERHTVAERDRLRRRAELRDAYDRRTADATETVRRHNAGVDEFERDFRAGEPDAVMQYFTLVLDASPYPEGFPHGSRVVYRREPRELVVEFELPPQALIPAEKGYKYVQTRDEIDTLPRPAKEVKDRYASLIARVALRTLHEVFTADPDGLLIDTVMFNGHVSTTDKATGQPIRPCLISAGATRELFSTFILTDLDPVVCLKRKLNAVMSRHPYDLEPVAPVIDFEKLLSQYKFVEGMDVVAGLDSRPDLLKLSPYEFEQLIKQLFEARGMKSWVTQASKDDGVDAVAVNTDPVLGGQCIIQAKRYSKAVDIEAVRAVAGVMDDKRATKGILVTTSWVGKASRDFAERHGRIQIIECEELKYLCKEHLDLDVLISLPKPPPKHR